MYHYKVIQRDGIPFLDAVPGEVAIYDSACFPTKQGAVDDYLELQLSYRADYLSNINRNMNRISSCQRKIRQAKKLLE